MGKSVCEIGSSIFPQTAIASYQLPPALQTPALQNKLGVDFQGRIHGHPFLQLEISSDKRKGCALRVHNLGEGSTVIACGSITFFHSKDAGAEKRDL